MTWYCAIVGLSVTMEADGRTLNKMISAFGVTAESYPEAMGKAILVTKRMEKKYPSYSHWDVVVNQLGDSALVHNPDNILMEPQS